MYHQLLMIVLSYLHSTLFILILKVLQKRQSTIFYLHSTLFILIHVIHIQPPVVSAIIYILLYLY